MKSTIYKAKRLMIVSAYRVIVVIVLITLVVLLVDRVLQGTGQGGWQVVQHLLVPIVVLSETMLASGALL